MADINVGQLAEAINDKTDRDLMNVDTGVGADAVIEYQMPTAENNYTWYRKYKSGWVEQGGYVDGNYSHTFSGTYMSSYTATTITLPVEMANTNVNIYCNSTVGQVIASGVLNGTTALEIMLASANYTASGVDISWQVSGLSAN